MLTKVAGTFIGDALVSLAADVNRQVVLQNPALMFAILLYHLDQPVSFDFQRSDNRDLGIGID
jgi:hypothetical protein